MRRGTVLQVVAAVALSAAALAQSPAGRERQVNAYTNADQAYPAICQRPGGEYVVAWESDGQDGSGRGVFARRLTAAGEATGAEFPLNQETAGNQQLPALACHPDGGFTAVWESQAQDGDGYGIFARRFDSQNKPAGDEFQVNGVSADNQLAPRFCSDSAGRTLVAWHSFGQDGDGYGVFARRYRADGEEVGDEFRVNTETALNQQRPAVACLPDGNTLVVWQSRGQDGDGDGIFAQLYDDSGAAVGGEFQVNEQGAENQRAPTVTAAADGFLVAWESSEHPDGHRIYARRLNGSGEVQGGDFPVNVDDFALNEAPLAAGDADGNAVVAWSGGLGRHYDVLARRYEPSGKPLGGDLQLSSATTGNQGAVSFVGRGLAIGGDADAQVIAWQSTDIRGDSQDGSGSGVFARPFAPCPGDCVPDGHVEVAELVMGVNIAIGVLPADECTALDSDGDGLVGIGDLVAAVRAGLTGCDSGGSR